jgi:hypothetical protein
MNMRHESNERPWGAADRVSALVMALLLTIGAAGCLLLALAR